MSEGKPRPRRTRTRRGAAAPVQARGVAISVDSPAEAPVETASEPETGVEAAPASAEAQRPSRDTVGGVAEPAGGAAGEAQARAAKEEPASGPDAAPRPATPPHVDRSVCLCAGLGPLLTQAIRTLTVPEEVKRSVHETEREALRLLRTLIEMRLSTLGGDDSSQPPARGVRLTIS